MSKFNALTYGVLALAVALLCVGCGEEQVNFIDPNSPPPLSSDDTEEARTQDQIVEEAERAEAAKTAPTSRKR